MPLRPEDLNLSALPRTSLGHLKTDAVGDLLQHAAWDYREALAQNQRLANTVQELTRRVEELTAEVDSLQAAAARRKEPDELARSLLASAQRAAREERESARRDAESIMKKATRRAEQMQQLSADHLAELARLEALRDDAVTRLRGMLEAIVSRHADTDGRYGVLEHDEAASATP